MSNSEKIISLINDGLTAKEINAIIGGHINTVYATATRYGLTISRANVSALAEHDEQIRYLKSIGKSNSEIAEVFNCSAGSVARYCESRNISIPSELRTQVCNRRHSDDFVSETVSSVSNGTLEYVSGYKRKEDPIVVRCLICGNEFERAAQGILYKGSVKCPYCEEHKRFERETAKQIEKQARQAERHHIKELRIQKQHEEQERKRKEREHPCPVCGTITDRRVYCSNRCAKNAEHKRREIKRRHKISDVMVDSDITVKGLFKRDNGICHICGKKCNTEDYVMRGKTFIAGDWYPSIDHVIPLAKGGEHSWDNVALAHRRCNYLKSDK